MNDENERGDQETGLRVVGPNEGLATTPLALESQVIAQVKGNINLAKQLVSEVLEAGTDWGFIPNSQVKRPMLFEPGAHTIMSAFRCSAQPEVLREEIDPDVYLAGYLVRVKIIDRHGEVVASGLGTCSTREGKWGARWVANPEDYGFARVTLRHRASRYQNGADQYRIPNMDWGDLINTMLQMAETRALRDAVAQLPGVSSVLRRLFDEWDGKEEAFRARYKTVAPQGGAQRAPTQKAVSRAPSRTEQAHAQDPASPTNDEMSAFWVDCRNLGVVQKAVYAALSESAGYAVQSILNDWIGKGRTLAQAKAVVAQAAPQPEAPKPQAKRGQIIQPAADPDPGDGSGADEGSDDDPDDDDNGVGGLFG